MVLIFIYCIKIIKKLLIILEVYIKVVMVFIKIEI